MSPTVRHLSSGAWPIGKIDRAAVIETARAMRAYLQKEGGLK